jgi:hypothetical protein
MRGLQSVQRRAGAVVPTTRIGRVGLALVLATAVLVGIILVVISSSLIRTGWQELPSGNAPGADFAVLYTAGSMVAEGDGADAYDPVAFAEAMEVTIGLTDVDRTGDGFGYRYPPPLAQALSITARLGFTSTLIVWMVASVLALVLGLRLLRGHGSAVVVFLAVASVPAWFTLVVGQVAFFWLLVLAGAYALGNRGAYFAAGAVAGLLILKPTLLAAMIVLLVVHRKSISRALAGVLTTTLGVVTISYIADPEMWAAYVATPFQAASDMSFLGFLTFMFSIPDSLVLAHVPMPVAIATGALIIAAAAAFTRSRIEPTWINILVISVPLTLVAVPHMFAYDWMLLAVPLLVAWERWPNNRDYVWLAAGLLSAASFASPIVATELLARWGWGFQLAAIACTVVLISLLSALAIPRGRKAMQATTATE